MTHEINQLLMVLGIAFIAAILLFFGVINSTIIQDYKECKRIFKDFCKGDYQYIVHYGNQYWFSRNDEVGQSYQYNEIVFFGVDGGIKLRENYYIHRGLLTFTFVHRYYYKKFHRVREHYINQYRFNEEYRRMSSNRETEHYDRYMKKYDGSFKFFRG